MAFGSPPLTGASSISTPFAFSASLISRLASGAIELMSIRTRPGFAPSIRPFSPSATSCTCGELGNMVMTTSHCSAIALAVRAVSAPAAIRSAITSGLRSETTSE
ncbi:hypothetical protein D3C86_1525690 [compost metagenome]